MCDGPAAPLKPPDGGGSVVVNRILEICPMAGIFVRNAWRARRVAAVAATCACLVLPVLTQPAAARGPDGIADVAENVIDAVVNISTKQKINVANGEMP
jgi:hypothetical protein